MKVFIITSFLISLSLCQSFLKDDNDIIQAIDAPNTPAAIGPYSKGTKISLGDKSIIFLSGAIGLKPDGELVSDDIQLQTQQILENLKALLEYEFKYLHL
jgi:enamine deaminase RidA (YjgF/YER057c/UK114 family)